MQRHIFAGVLALPLLACAQVGDSDNDTVTTVELEGSQRPAFDPLPAGDSTPSPAPVASPAAPQAVATIPPRFRGRWGLIAADCEAGRPDAKGLMEVTGEVLRFYESKARPAQLAQLDATTLRGRFAFTGEGMEWERTITLDLEDGGARLTRSEEGAGALPEPLRYTRCPA